MTASPQPAASESPGLRLRSVREGRLLAGPETLQLNLHNGCNAGCIFCWNHSPLLEAAGPEWQRQRLSEAHLQCVLDALPRLRPERVLLSGRGEPLVHPQVGRLLATLQELHIPVSVQTNGIAGPSPEQLADLGVSQLLVNVSAGTRAGYERVHPQRAAHFEAIVDRLERLAELRGGGFAPQVTLVAVIQQTNGSELGPLVELAARVGAIGVQLRGMELVGGLEQLMLTGQARSRVHAELERTGELAAKLDVELQAEHLRRVLAAPGAAGRFTEQLATGPCFMGWYYLRVTCDGRVMFCCKDKVVDHLDRRPLYRIWRSAGYQLLRLAGRDGDTSIGLFDDKCRACSNVLQNEQIRCALAVAGS